MVIRATAGPLDVAPELADAADPSAWRVAFDVLSAAGLWSRFTRHGPFASSGSDKVPIADPASVAQAAAQSGERSWGLQVSTDDNAGHARVLLVRGAATIDLYLAGDVDEDDIKRAVAFIDGYLAASEGRIRGLASVSLAEVGIPRVRPPRVFQGLLDGALVDWIDPDTTPIRRAPQAATRAALLRESLPSGAERFDIGGGRVKVAWGAVDDWASTLAARQRWLAEHLGGTVHKGFHPTGDEVHPISNGATAHKPLGAYDRARRRGYKRVVTRDGAGLSEEKLAQVHDWMRDGALPDGTELRELWLLTYTRDEALAVSKRLAEVGATGVLWHDAESDTFWDPNPSGPWLD